MKRSVTTGLLIGIFFVSLVYAATSSISLGYGSKTNITIGNNWTNLELSDSDIFAFVNFEADLVNTEGINIHEISSGNNYGTAAGNAYVNSTECIYGGCVKFDGVGDYVDFGDVINISSGNFSVSVWVKSMETTGDGYNVAWSLYANDTNVIWLTYPKSAGTSAVLFSHVNSGSWTISSNIVDPVDTDWHMVTTVFNGANWTYYYDGSIVVSETKLDLGIIQEGNAENVVNFSIGRAQDGNRMFNGSMDEVLVFNRSLNNSEISDLYNNQTDYFKQTGEMVLNNGSDYNFVAGWTSANVSFDTENTNSNVNISYSFGFYNGTDWNYTGFSSVTDAETYAHNFASSTTNISINLTYESNSTRETPYLNELITLTKLSDSTEYYVSASGDGTNPHSWDGAWQTLADVQWGADENEVNAGDILYIDEGQYEEPLAFGANGSDFKLINSTNYEWLMSTSNSNLASDGWVVVTAGASDGTLDEEVIISGARLLGKSSIGSVNSGFSNTVGYTTVYEATRDLSGVAEIFWECNTTNLSIKNACVYLDNKSSVSDVNSTEGSFYWNDTSNILYVHANNGINVTESTNDYQLVIAENYPMDVTDVDGIVLDGGFDNLLRLSFGDNVDNGLVKHGTGDTISNMIMRNHKQLYGKPNEATHFWHLDNSRIIFYNMEMGKAGGNQAYSHSLIDVENMYGFVINNTIWDGYESHGNSVDENLMKEYIVSGNTFKQEFYGGHDDGGTLKFLTIDLEEGFVNITDNNFIDLHEFFNYEGAGDNVAAIHFRPSNSTDGNINSTATIKNNNITLTDDAVEGRGIYVESLYGAVAVIEDNYIANFDNDSSNHLAIVFGGDLNSNVTANNSIIQRNVLVNNFEGIYLYGDLAYRFFDINNLTIRDNIINVTNLASSAAIVHNRYFGNNTVIENNTINTEGSNQNRATTLYANGNIEFRNNYLNGYASGVMIYGLTAQPNGTLNIYNNIFDSNYLSLRMYDYDNAAYINVYNNVFYNGTVYSLHLESGSASTNNITVQNNIFYDNNIGLEDDSANSSFSEGYNIFYSNTEDSRISNVATSLASSDITEDPLFSSASTGNFSLNESSPAIDAANSSLSYPTDYYGNSRVDITDEANSGVGTYAYYDIGAIEYQTQPTATITEEGASQSGSGALPTYYLTETNMQEGYTRQLAKNWKLKFTSGGEEHQLKIDSLNTTDKTATITISSDPQTETLSIGEEWKVNLDNDTFYDLLVRLDNITSIRANIFIQEIEEEVESEIIEEEDTPPLDEVVGDEVAETNFGLILGGIFIALALIALAFLVGKKYLKK